MNTNEERAEAFREAMLLDLGDFDAIDIELEPLMFGVTGELTSEGQRLRAEFVSVETTQRVQQVKREQDWEPQGGGSPGM